MDAEHDIFIHRLQKDFKTVYACPTEYSIVDTAESLVHFSLLYFSFGHFFFIVYIYKMKDRLFTVVDFSV